MRLLKHLLLGLLMAAMPASVHANGLMAIDSSGATIAPLAVEISTSVRDQVATTVVRQRFVNSASRPLSLRFLYPLGTSATVTGFRFWQHGELRVASITGRPQDSTIYDTLPGGALPDRRLLAYLGASPFVFPFLDALRPDSSIVVELTTVELLRYAGGKVRMHIPFDMRTVGGGPIDLTLRFALESGRDITSFETFGLSVDERQGTRSCTAGATVPGFAADHDIDIVYGLAQSALGVTLMSNKPDTSDGYFLMLAEPNPETSQDAVIGKCFTFVIDASGSMAGQKIEQAKAAARYTIEHLNAGDIFNVIRFSSDCTRLYPEPVAATPSNVAAAIGFIEAMVAAGGTNIQGALLLALAQPLPVSTANVVIFVTDGIASVDQQQIIDANTRGARIYVFGIGTDVNRDMLTTLAAGNRGLAEFLGTDDVTTRISGFYDKIRSPILKDVAIAFSGGEVSEIYPLHLPDIYVGEQLVLLGRYHRPGPAVATVSGHAQSGDASFDYPVVFAGDGLADPFVPKMWAKSKIDELLVLMSGVPPSSPRWREWRAEIVRLSLAYGILSPFSSFGDPGGNGGGNGGGGGGASAVEWETGDVRSARSTTALRVVPSPVHGAARISYRVDGGGDRVRVRVCDALGRSVLELFDDVQTPGEHELVWHSDGLAPGIYFVTVDVGGVTSSVAVIVA